MHLASVFVGVWLLAVGAVLAVPPVGIPVVSRLPLSALGGVAVVPAGLTVATSARAAAARQLASQLNQARRASVSNAIAQAQAAQSIGNQANNAAVRNAITQSNAEQLLLSQNLAHAARNAIAQAQQAQVQVGQSNSAAVRNAAIQALQGNSAAAAHSILAGNAQLWANSLRLAPAPGPVVVGVGLARGPVLGVGVGVGRGPGVVVGRPAAAPAVARAPLRDQIAVEAPAIPVTGRYLNSPLVGSVGWGRKG